MLEADAGFLVRDTVVFVCEILDCCPWFEFSDLEVSSCEPYFLFVVFCFLEVDFYPYESVSSRTESSYIGSKISSRRWSFRFAYL